MHATSCIPVNIYTCTPALPSHQVGTPAHKLSRTSHNDEEAHILRVPVAMAMTKLLLALPESTLHRHLPRYRIRGSVPRNVCLFSGHEN